jgi:putative selenate reductase molybdopterin-binding subunit
MPDSHHGLVGTPTIRIDGWEKVTGNHRFLDDLPFDGCLWAQIIRSPYPRARLQGLNDDAILAMPDVLALHRAVDLPAVRFNPALAPDSPQLRAAADRTMLTDLARHVGDGVAVVIARTQEAATAAVRSATGRWEQAAPVLDIDAALRANRVIGRFTFGDPHAVAALARSPVVVGDRFEIDAAQHVCLETHRCVAMPDGTGGITLWSNTQSPAELRRLVAETIGLPQDRLRVRKTSEGGGFGCRQEMYEEALVCWLALRHGHGVRLTYDRTEEFTATRRRHNVRLDVTMGADNDGTLRAADIHAVVDAGGYASHTPYVSTAIAVAAKTLYPRLQCRFRGEIVRTDTMPTGAYRGYGLAQATFAIESLVDRLARSLGMDPVAVRCRNAAHPRMLACIERGESRFAWPQPVMTDGSIVTASGMATAVKGTTTGDESDVSRASVVLTPDGAVLRTGTCDSGTGSSTVLAQVVADELNLPLAAVTVVEGDTARAPVDVGSAGQRSVVLGAGAARLAARAATAQPGHEVSFRAGQAPVSYCACFVTVTVDVELGSVRVINCLMVTDCGRVLNPLGARGQVQGGAAQGIGLALIDAWCPGDDGSGPTTVLTHGVPGSLDVPAIEVDFVDTAVPGMPYGAVGLGEIPIVPIAAAIGNAVAAATGADITRTPMRPATVWAAVQRHRPGDDTHRVKEAGR